MKLMIDFDAWRLAHRKTILLARSCTLSIATLQKRRLRRAIQISCILLLAKAAHLIIGAIVANLRLLKFDLAMFYLPRNARDLGILL